MITSEQLAGIAGVILSLFFTYVPGVKARFDALTSEYKASVMGLSLIVVAVAIFAGSCGGLLAGFPIQVTCTRNDAVALIMNLVAALVANQATFTLAVKPFKK